MYPYCTVRTITAFSLQAHTHICYIVANKELSPPFQPPIQRIDEAEAAAGGREADGHKVTDRKPPSATKTRDK